MAVYKLTPTKANLIKAKNSLEFAEKGYDLLDKKRTVLIREMMGLVEDATKLQKQLEEEFKVGYQYMVGATISLGTERVEEVSKSVQIEPPFEILPESVMGVETPRIIDHPGSPQREYSFFNTNADFDKAYLEAHRLRSLIYRLAELENAVFRLALEIKKTQKRANALDKIQIPKYKKAITEIEDTLAEKEREEFFRLKKMKKKKMKRS